MRILTIVVSLLVSVSAYAQGRVGGPCSYDEYSGTCTATGKNADGKVLFVFDGEMRGEKISLADNIADEGFAPDARASCFLMFIKEGTCTPCLFSVGACGERGISSGR